LKIQALMLIAHLPSGYILATLARRRVGEQPLMMAAALAGAMAPDLDMLYFYLIDAGKTHHHAFISHWPLFWLASGLVSLALGKWLVPRYLPAVGMFFAGVMLHMVLDSIAAPIFWLLPFDATPVELVKVPASYGNWVLSFALHWTFLLELAICAWAGWLALGDRRTFAEAVENRA
jgi:inner membrane protein